jgi:hypothetical protein
MSQERYQDICSMAPLASNMSVEWLHNIFKHITNKHQKRWVNWKASSDHTTTKRFKLYYNIYMELHLTKIIIGVEKIQIYHSEVCPNFKP